MSAPPVDKAALHAAAGALLVAASLCAAAQPSPPVDLATPELLRQQERDRVQREQLQREPDVRAPHRDAGQSAEMPPGSDTPCFPIHTLALEGDGAERFAFALDAVPGHADWADEPACLGTRGIGAVLQQVQSALVARGFVTTRVFAEPQDLTTGKLRLTVIPGRVRAIRIDDDGSGRGTAWNAVPTRPGRLLDLRDIEQGLENLKRVPSAEADIQIAPGELPGESDLLIRWRQAFPWRVGLSLDDSGGESTGKLQAGVTLSYDHWWTLNDLFYVTLSNDASSGDGGSKGTRGNTVHYSVPWGYWLLSATVSRHGYRQSVAGLNQTYQYSGSSANTELRVARNLYRDAVRKTGATFSAWTRRSNNFIDDTEVEVQRRRMGGWELGVTHRETLGAATLELDIAYRRGTGAGRSLPAPEEAFDEGTSRPRLAKAGAQLTLPATVAGQSIRFITAWRAQWNRTALVPQDRFAIGGRHTVRGFDGEASLSAEHGWLLRNELGWRLTDSGAELYVGLDHGEVGGPSAEQLLGRRLTGVVLGLRGSALGLNYDLFAGAPHRQPDGFRTAGLSAGFNLGWSR